MSQTTGSNHLTSGQVMFSDNQLSTSDLDIDVDELVHHSDHNIFPFVFQAHPVNMPGLLKKLKCWTLLILVILRML